MELRPAGTGKVAVDVVWMVVGVPLIVVWVGIVTMAVVCVDSGVVVVVVGETTTAVDEVDATGGTVVVVCEFWEFVFVRPNELKTAGGKL